MLRRILVVPILTMLVLSGTGPAALARGDDSLAPVRERVALLRKLTGGSLYDAIRAAAVAAGKPEAVPPTAPSAGPRSLRAAIRAIGQVVETADRDSRGSSAARRGRAIGIARLQRLALRVLADPDLARGMPTADAGPALRSAARIAAAVDAALPFLVAAPPLDGAAECDLLENNVCVGGQGPNRYSSEFPVIIDLGGDDTYVNDGAGVAVGAQLIVDVAGNDVYDPATANGAHGYGGLGGVGMLVDLAGSDRYSLTDLPGGVAQGTGVFGGVGALIDGGGSDVYEVRAHAAGADSAVAGQGAGVFGAVGILVDGGGDDRYALTARAESAEQISEDEDGTIVRELYLGTAGAGGQGDGVLAGAGLLADAGGQDSFEIEAVVAPIDPEEIPFRRLTTDVAAGPTASGQGIAIAGGAFLLAGSGRSTYSIRAIGGPVTNASGPYDGAAQGQGLGAVGGPGVLSDAGGDDRYTLESVAASSVARSATDGCACSEPVLARVGMVHVVGQGYGVDAVGLLDDAAGNDVYAASAESQASVAIQDPRGTVADVLTGEVTSGEVVAFVQGMAAGPGSGILADGVGNDSYSVAARNLPRATGTSALDANAPSLRTIVGRSAVAAQGAGFGQALTNGSTPVWGPAAGGLLVDAGGRDDYASTVIASGSVNGTVEPGPVVQRVQGASWDIDGLPAHGFLSDADGGAGDTFAQYPPSPACVGARGEAVWRDCSGVAGGVNS